MRKRQSIAVGVVFLCCLLLLAAPAGAAGSGNPGGMTMAAARDSSGELIAADFAVVVCYGDTTYVDVPASLVSAQAASYEVIINDTRYPMQYDSAWDIIEVAEFAVKNSNNSLGAPRPGIASKDEQVFLVYYYPSNGSYLIDTAKIKITGSLELDSGVVLYDFEQLENLQSGFCLPMSVVNESGQVVAYASQTGSGVAVYTYVYDAAGFSDGGTPQPASTPAPQPTSDPSSGGSTGRDPVTEAPTAPVQEPEDQTLLYVGAGVAVVVVAGLVFFFARGKKKGGNPSGGSAAPAYYPPTVPSGYPSTAPEDISPIAPADIPPTVPTPVMPPVQPAGPKKVIPVVYGEGGEMDGRRYVIAQPAMTIGREKSCNICYSADTPGISHQHCVLAMRNGVLMLIDNGSTYGTYLRGTGRLTPQQPAALKDGDVFYLGEKKNAFRLTFE